MITTENNTNSIKAAPAEDWIRRINTQLTPLQSAIATHPVLTQLTTLTAIQTLMTQHVFAVWDFINLVKALHSRLTKTTPIWLPPAHPDSVRLLTEIILEEETDQHPHPTTRDHVSHFTLYREAMIACGANTAPIEACLAHIKQQMPLEKALTHTAILPSTRAFVQQTFEMCQAPLPALAASFVFGREGMVPHFFTPWLKQIKQHQLPHCEPLVYYLERHIHLDSQAHFPKALQLLTQICGRRPTHWLQAKRAAIRALKVRIDFLDGVLSLLAD